MVSELPQRPRRSPVSRFLNPRFLSLRLLAIFMVSSIFCYWLAWYLSAPVRKLRAATRQLASGDLKTRVGPNLGGRKDELADLGHDFDLMTERIESLIAARNRLLRDVSHELCSPLTRLNVALELARRRSGREAEESLDRIERESERLNKLIGQLRTLTLMESSAENIDKKTFDLSRLVKGISDDADFEARSRNRSVKAELNENIIVDGSEELLRRAIENVVRNAIRYTDEGTKVEISLQRRLLNGEQFAVLKIRDHGPGVPEDALANLFTPFYRVAESRDLQSGGMGIGLAITDRAARLHGGSVTASNAPEGGLVVEMDLPVTSKNQ
jgi:two-component system sensor histidine kinase CpxA